MILNAIGASVVDDAGNMVIDREELIQAPQHDRI